MPRRRTFAALLSFLGLAAPAAWLLWPVTGPPPWREEVGAAERAARLEARARPVTSGAVERWLPLLDPDGVLSETEDVEALAGAARGVRNPAAPAVPDPEAPLAGLRIVLDPGHHGGAWSEVESRHFVVWSVADADGARLAVTAGEDAPPPGPGATRRGVLREGDLAWATTRLLQDALARAGAEVHLTRGPPPAAPFPAGADPRFDPEHEARLLLDERRHTDPWLRSWSRLLPARLARAVLEREVRRLAGEDLHDLYTRFDLRRRAALAAEVDADLTLSIHYNLAVHPELNYVVVFMPGYARAEELATPSARFHQLARLLEGDLDLTAAVGKRVGRALHRHLGMPPPPPFDPPPGARTFRRPIQESDRLFVRNLAMVRRTPGPVLLLEGPFMNNPDEALRLLDDSVEVDGRRYPSRARTYAAAVVEALEASATLLHRRRAGRVGEDPYEG